MKQSKFSEAQMVSMLREADRSLVAAVAKANGISEHDVPPRLSSREN